MSVTTPPNWGVNPPGAISRKEKQFGSSNTRARAAWSGTLSVTRTVGQLAEPSTTPSRASSTSAIISVSPSSRL